MAKTKIRILLLADDPADAVATRKRLLSEDRLGYDVVCMDRLSAERNGPIKKKVDIILLAISTRDNDGLGFFHHLQNQYAGVPIIVLADAEAQSLAIRAVREGALDYLFKDQMSTMLLVRSLRYALEREQLLSTLERQTEALKSSEARFRKIISENADGIVIINKDRKVLFANPSAENILGRKPAKIIGRPHRLPINLDEKSEVEIPLDGRLARTAETRVVETEWEGRKAYLISLHDITERKIAERSLRESERLSQSIIETASDAFLEMDACGLILRWNQKAEETFGWSKDEVIGRSFIETIFPTRHRDSHLRSIIDFLSTGRGPFLCREIEVTAIHRDGHEFPVELRLWPLRDEGICHINAFIRDITEIRHLQQLKEEFIHTVSHEMRTPLTTIREGISQVADGLLGDTTAEQRKFFSMILQDIDRLTRIINDLLDVSQIESGMMKLNVEQFDMAGLIEGIRSAFQVQAEERGLSIKADLPGREVMVHGDRDKILQVMTNLVGNALKFTKKGEIRIVLMERPDGVECCVSDTGGGIPEEDLPMIFDKFRQFGKTRRSGEKGTGLGLYIARSIVQLHDGEIWAESEVNRGSRFHFTLPRTRASETAPVSG